MKVLSISATSASVERVFSQSEFLFRQHLASMTRTTLQQLTMLKCNRGNLFTTRCTSCGFIEENNDSPICEALRNRGLPNESGPEIPTKDLPSGRKCQSFVRSHVVWFEESLWPDIIDIITDELNRCDLFLVVCFCLFHVFLMIYLKVETSGVVYPAAGFARMIAAKGVSVVEVNVEKTPYTDFTM
ncbi:unnamed protein product [Rotaria sp. Silwood2]|nr:unnamed protein product [Rotaria sp. Silwood2]CAF2832912.1 unnamed protein product [Rotaria sp. Silwood2]CAF3089827.1 unnamed protein product [Rotaria sp. Silwood2]CAF3252425.1 unnamed protein product [Rotaria sp. Silwood2]CAF4258970.1 unnamed protein product [Rotaria sp. Silwood2]